MSVSRSEEDFWSTFNLYYMTRSGSEKNKGVNGPESLEEVWKDSSSSVFNAEVSLLDALLSFCHISQHLHILSILTLKF